MANRLQLEQWLQEAETARHQLMVGLQAVQVRDSNGDMITYSTANASRLDAYIVRLKSELNALNMTALSGPLRPIWS